MSAERGGQDGGIVNTQFPGYEKDGEKRRPGFLPALLRGRRAVPALLLAAAVLASAALVVTSPVLLRVADLTGLGSAGAEAESGSRAQNSAAKLFAPVPAQNSAPRAAPSGEISSAGDSWLYVFGGREIAEKRTSGREAIRAVIWPEESKNGFGVQGIPLADMTGGAAAVPSDGDFRPAAGSLERDMNASHPQPVSMRDTLAMALRDTEVPGGIRQAYSKARGGRLSPSAWKSVAAMKNALHYDISGVPKPGLRQLSDTFRASSLASAKRALPETKTFLLGMTYGGAKAGAALLADGGNGEPVRLSATSLSQEVLLLSGQAEAAPAGDCARARLRYGAQLERDGQLLENLSVLFQEKPACRDHAVVEGYNRKAGAALDLCTRVNLNGQLLASACKSGHKATDCGAYARLRVSPCGRFW